jgi:co-chaperonin GroES (HSP10)
MQAIGKNIIVKPVKKDDQKIIIQLKQDQPIHWEVISIGEEINNLKVGDKVHILLYGGHDWEYNGEKYRVITPDNVFCKE